MRRLSSLALAMGVLLAAPASAQMNRQCQALLDNAMARMKQPSLSARYAGTEGSWCVFKALRLDTPFPQPDVAADTLRLRGTAPEWFLLGEGTPDTGLDAELRIDGLRIFVKAGAPNEDYLDQLASAVDRSSFDLALTWDAGANELSLTRFIVDFPGQNALSATAGIGNVDLSSQGGLQMAATGFAVRHIHLDITSNGLFESVLLLPLGAMLLAQDGAQEGDRVAVAEALRSNALAGLLALPETAFPAATKDALAQVVAAMPNPAGRLSLDFRAEGGFGPARLAGFALYGVPRTMAQAAPLFRGVTLDATWTAGAAP